MEKYQKAGFAVVGAGRWGINHIRTLAQEFGEELRWVVDTENLRETRVKEVWPEARFTSRLQDVLDDKHVNAIVLATPAETHFILAKAALEAGKNLLVEKPLALFTDQARELDALAKEKDRVLMVGHLLLYHQAIRKIKSLIDDGTIGKLQYIYSNRLNLGTVRKEENILWSFAPHDISVLQYLVGSDPVEIDARGGVFLQPGIHDVTLTSLVFPENVQAHIHVSWLHPFKEQRLVVIGDRSMIVFEDSRPSDKLILYPKGIDWINGEPIKRDEGFEVIDFDSESPLLTELKHFRDCVINGQQPLTDGANGVRVLEILEMAQQKLEARIGDHEQPSPAKAVGTKKEDFFVHPTSVVDDGCDIGKGTKIWHYSHIQTGAVIGEKVSIGQNVNVANNVRIGNFVKIQNNVSVYEGVELEDYVFCGPSMVFTNVLDPRCEFPQRGGTHYVPTRVGYGASIGANATVICGTTIGRFAFIGAGAVVTRDVPEYALLVGNPARQIGWMCRCGQRLEVQQDRSTCQRCQRQYRKTGDQLICINENPDS